jgi:hypothetical protein
VSNTDQVPRPVAPTVKLSGDAFGCEMGPAAVALLRAPAALGASSPEYVRPHVKAQKNDDRDAGAAIRPTMRLSQANSFSVKTAVPSGRIRRRLIPRQCHPGP